MHSFGCPYCFNMPDSPDTLTSRKGLLFAFEGIDGSGKSTQMNLLADRLKGQGFRVHCTAEPTSGPMGTLIRDAFNHRNAFSDAVIAGLFVADRLHHITDAETGILTMLEQGYVVLTDRYYLSSYAYQGVHVPMDWVIAANAFAASICPADLHIYIDVPPDTAIGRLFNSRLEIEKYETLDNLQSVYQQYRYAIDRIQPSEAVSIFSGTNPKETLTSEIWNSIESMLSKIDSTAAY